MLCPAYKQVKRPNQIVGVFLKHGFGESLEQARIWSTGLSGKATVITTGRPSGMAETARLTPVRNISDV